MVKDTFDGMTVGASVTEYILLETQLRELIRQWLGVEIGKRPAESTSHKVLEEILQVNIKAINELEHKVGRDMRDSIFNKNLPESGNQDYTISRIQDLYLYICSTMPPEFVEDKQRKYEDVLSSLDLTGKSVVPYAWLLAELSYVHRYAMTHLPD